MTVERWPGVDNNDKKQKSQLTLLLSRTLANDHRPSNKNSIIERNKKMVRSLHQTPMGEKSASFSH